MDLNLILPSRFDKLDDVATMLKEAKILVKDKVIKSKRRQKEYYDKKHRFMEFPIGHKVLVYTKIRMVGLSEKLINGFNGP